MPEGDVARPRAARFVMGDMVRSLGLLLVIIVGLLFLGPARSLILPGSKDKMPAIDYSGAVRGFAEVTGRSALVPQALPSSWHANAANVASATTTAHLHIGWAVPGTAFAGLDEGNGNADSLLRQVTGSSSLQSQGDTTIDGATWTVRRSDRDETVYTRTINGVFVVITGNATDAQLRLLAQSLH